MQIQNSEIAGKFYHLADLLEIGGENPFRVRAYRNAARTLEATSENIEGLVERHQDLTVLPGIGKDLAGKIVEIVNTGHFALLEKTEERTPAELVEFLKIPSLGPKRVQRLYQQFGIKSLSELKEISESKKILKVRGFGEKIRSGILSELKRMQDKPHKRLTLNIAEESAALVLKYLKTSEVQQLAVAGSFRRKQETVGDLDILITSKNAKAVTEHFLKLPLISKIVVQGPTRSTVVLRSGIQVDLRVVPNLSYGAALLYFTGSKAHNIEIRKMAMKRGLKINEYGLFKGQERVASKTEEEIYHFLKLPFIEPELRENRGEIEAAINGTLPKLITEHDIQGDLHIHTNETDGMDGLRSMALAAKKMGYSYLGISDHSKRMAMTHGLDSKRLRRQVATIDKINDELDGITILKSCEVDILEDGSLDLPDEALALLDYTVCAIHSNFNLSRAKQTERIIRAMENPYFRILAHPTGRIIGEREPYELDLEKIIQAAKKLSRILEMNAQPERMDLSDVYCRMAKDAGVKCAISTDSHSISQLNFMGFGVGLARRAWLEKGDVINTLSLKQLKMRLK